MRLDKSATAKFKCVCADFPNHAILTKSASLVHIQVTFGHASIGNKSLGKPGISFDLVGSLESPTVVTIDTNHAFASSAQKIRLPLTEVLLRATVGNLVRSKNLRD